MKTSIRKEINITVNEMAHKLKKDGGLLDDLCERIKNILYIEYDVDWDTAEDTICTVDDEELIEILEAYAKKLKEDYK